MNRFIKITVALLVAVSGFLVVGGSTAGAQAREQRATAVAGASAASPTTALPTRSVVIHRKRVTNVGFRVWATIKPAGGKKRVKLQYSRTIDGHFKTIRRDKMNERGRATFGRVRKVGWYRVVAPQTLRYAKSISPLYLHIYR